MKDDMVTERIGVFEHGASIFFHALTVDNQIDALMLCKVADDLRIDPGNGLELSRPIAAKMRPGKPRGNMRFPFGWHAIAESGGEFSLSCRTHFPSSMRLVIGA